MDMKMCRESRKIFNELDSIAKSNSVQGIITPAHCYICDELVLRYFTQAMINIIRTKIKTIKNKEWKHFTIEYWQTMIISMLKNTPRDNSTLLMIRQSQSDLQCYTYIISQYLLVDYSLGDTLTLLQLCNRYTYDEVVYACSVGRTNSVYEIRYINAVLEKERAKKQVIINQTDRLNKRAEKSNIILEQTKQIATPIDIAVAQYNWQQKQKDKELEEEFNKLFGGK